MTEALATYPAVPMRFGFSAGADATWGPGRQGALEERDLAIDAASDGQIRAVELRARHEGSLNEWSGAMEAVFTFLYVIEGEIAFTMSDDAVVTMRRREAVHLPFLREVKRARHSADFLAAEMTAPGHRTTGELAPLLRMQPERMEGDWERAIVRNRPELFIPGDGPRAFFTYRDLGSAKLTDRRIQIHDGDGARRPMAGGTGWHDHSMSQFFFVLGGEATIAVEGHGEYRVVPGDVMAIGARMRHNVSSYSEGYNVFEVCMPADYDTVATPAPAT